MLANDALLTYRAVKTIWRVTTPEATLLTDLNKILKTKMITVQLQNKEVIMAKRLIRLKEVETKIGFKKSKIWVMIRNGEFPKPIKIGDRAVAWLESDIDAWIDKIIEGA